MRLLRHRRPDGPDLRFRREALPCMDGVYSLALCMTRDPGAAEDLVEECFATAYATFHECSEDTDIRAWLYRVLTDTYIAARPHTLVPEQGEDRRDRPGVSPGSAGEMERLPGSAVRRALHGLPVRFRVALHLADVEGFGYRDIAHIMNAPSGTVARLLCHGRHRLREILAEGYPTPCRAT